MSPKNSASKEVLVDNGDFSICIEKLDDGMKVYFSGVLNEEADLTPLITKFEEARSAEPEKEFVFFLDLDEVAYLNSVGVRRWLQFINTVQNNCVCHFVNLPKLVISHSGVVPAMLGREGTKVVSFKAPYFCTSCDAIRDLVIQPSEVKREGENFTPPEKTCPECGSPMEFDELAEEYFHFLVDHTSNN